MVCLYTFSKLFSFLLKIPPPPPSVKKRKKNRKPNAPLKTPLNGLQIFRLTIFKRKWAMDWGRLRPLHFSPSPRQAKGSDWPQTSEIQANYFMVSELFLQTFFFYQLDLFQFLCSLQRKGVSRMISLKGWSLLFPRDQKWPSKTSKRKIA